MNCNGIRSILARVQPFRSHPSKIPLAIAVIGALVAWYPARQPPPREGPGCGAGFLVAGEWQ